MIQAAEDKAKADQAKKEAEEIVARTQEKLKKMEAKIDDARKAYELAQKHGSVPSRGPFRRQSR